MNSKLKKLLIAILVAICSAIVSFFSSCSFNWAIGDNNSPVNEQHSTLTADSTSFIRVGYK